MAWTHSTKYAERKEEREALFWLQTRLLHNVESEHVHKQSARIERTKGVRHVSAPFFMFCERYRAIGHAPSSSLIISRILIGVAVRGGQ